MARSDATRWQAYPGAMIKAPDAGAGEAADELPEDDVDAKSDIIPDNYALAAVFSAGVRRSSINPAGDVTITLAIPYEYKYDAMPITDMRGVLFKVAVFRPMKRDEYEAKVAKVKELERANRPPYTGPKPSDSKVSVNGRSREADITEPLDSWVCDNGDEGEA